MRVVHLNTWDLQGGASRGAYWMHKGLQQAGVDSILFSAYKSSGDPSVIGIDRPRLSDRLRREIRIYFNELPLRQYKHQSSQRFSPARFPENIESDLQKLNPDLINLHWICYGFLSPELIAKLNKPLVWTLRDMWGFTGGCHYTGDCTRYEANCGACPHLGSTQERDLSRLVWQRKHKAWQNLDITLVAVSHWIAECARRSNLFKHRRIEVIPNSIDGSIFKPRSKATVREILELPQDKQIILFSALEATSDERKGFQYLVGALQQLAQTDFKQRAELVVVGASQPSNPPDLGMKANYLGMLNDNLTLAMAYAAADVAIVPSLQDACPKIPIEALACGTPVVCFDTGGLKDIVEHEQTGYRAKCYRSRDLAQGIAWVLQDRDRWNALSQQARIKVEREFTQQVQAQAYLKLYRELLDRSPQDSKTS
jgi:glycosyltransferase involved in cell wall biosynthesis